MQTTAWPMPLQITMAIKTDIIDSSLWNDRLIKGAGIIAVVIASGTFLPILSDNFPPNGETKNVMKLMLVTTMALTVCVSVL